MKHYPPEDDQAPDAFERRLIEHFSAHRSEPTDVAQRTWDRIVPLLGPRESSSRQGAYQMKEMKDQNTDAPDSLHVTTMPEYTARARPKGMPLLVRFAVPVVVVMVIIVGFVFALKTITPQGKTGATPGSAATTQPIPPTHVTLEAHFGTTTVTTSHVTVPAGTKVTLTVIPDHPLTPFQILTMGIYAQDPYPFSELKFCKYPDTATCTYTLAFSQSENTDYTKGTHTFVAFLGEISGNINQNSDPITITWS